MNIAPLIRILLRYACGVLVAYGYLAPDETEMLMDPELIGLIAGAATEVWYAWARRNDKAT